jgi:DNA-binding NarL/FixJ family response regulator
MIKMIEILVADDHPIIREGVKQILKNEPDIVVKSEASNGVEVLKLIKKNKYDLILLDISLPKKDGLEVLKEIKAKLPKIPILILSIHSDEYFIIDAIKNGASGYITKDTMPEELIKAIRIVYSGQIYINQNVTQALVDNIKYNREEQPHNILSLRELQVMIKIGEGKSIKEIANELSISSKTVSTYKRRILEKLGLKNNSEIIKYVMRHKLL